MSATRAARRPVLNLSHIFLVALLILNLFTKVVFFPNVDAYKAKKILYGMAAAHLLNMLKHVKTGPPKVYSHPYPVMAPKPYKPKCKKETHIHEHLNVLEDKYGGLGDFGDHYGGHGGGFSSKLGYSDDLDDDSMYHDDDFAADEQFDAGRASLPLGKKLGYRSKHNKLMEAEDMEPFDDTEDDGLEDTLDDEPDLDYADSSEQLPTKKKRPNFQSSTSFKTPIKSSKKILKKYMKIIKQKALSGDNDQELEEHELPLESETESTTLQNLEAAKVKPKTLVSHTEPPGERKTDHKAEVDDISESESSLVVNNSVTNSTSQPSKLVKSTMKSTTSKPFMVPLKDTKQITTARPKSIKSMLKNSKISKYLISSFESLGNKPVEVESWFKTTRTSSLAPPIDETSTTQSTTQSNTPQSTSLPETSSPTVSTSTTPKTPMQIIPIFQPQNSAPPNMAPMIGVSYPAHYPPPQPPPLDFVPPQYHHPYQSAHMMAMEPSMPLYPPQSSPPHPPSPNMGESFYFDTPLSSNSMEELDLLSNYDNVIARREDEPTTTTIPKHTTTLVD